jgi:hypothetical protein
MLGGAHLQHPLPLCASLGNLTATQGPVSPLWEPLI